MHTTTIITEFRYTDRSVTRWWNVFLLFFLSIYYHFGRSHLVPFSSCVLCSFSIHFIQIFDLLHYYYLFVKNNEKKTHRNRHRHILLTERLLTVNWIGFFFNVFFFSINNTKRHVPNRILSVNYIEAI